MSGGATSSFTLVHWGTMPEGINHLRIGEGILVSKDLQVDWGIHDMDYLRMDCMTLRAQIVEVKDKPTHPVGPIVVDCSCPIPWMFPWSATSSSGRASAAGPLQVLAGPTWEM